MTQMGRPLHRRGLLSNPESIMQRLTPLRSLVKFLTVTCVYCALAFGSGCVYQASLSQGNLLDQEDIDQVAVGMTRGQVRFLLGTPMIDDPFHENRWDYVYFLRIGRDKAVMKRWISVMFEEDRVVEVITDQQLRPDL